MGKAFRQRKTCLKPSCCRHRPQSFIAIYQNFDGRGVGRECLITSESYKIRKNRCDYRTKSKNIYADLKVCVNVFGSQAWAGKGFQSRKIYRLLKESVDVARSQACLWNPCEKTPEGLSPSYLKCPVVPRRENSVYSVQKLISLYVFSVSVVKCLFCRQKTVYGIREQQNKPWSDIIPIGKILHRCSVWASSESPSRKWGGNLKNKIELPPSAAGGAFIYLNAASMPLH